MPPARPLWRAHLALVRGPACPLTSRTVAQRVVAADPFILVAVPGDDRLELDLWVESDDASDAAARAWRAWRDLARVAGLVAEGRSADETAFEVVTLDLTRADGLREVRRAGEVTTARSEQ